MNAAADSTFRSDRAGRGTPLRRRGRRLRPKRVVRPLLTPMIDVTFLLLLYFLVTSSFDRSEGQIPGSLPQKAGIATTLSTPLRPIRIVLRPVGMHREGVQYELGAGVLTSRPRELHEMLKQRREVLGRVDVPVVIQCRGDVRWRYVVEAFNAAVAARFRNIGFPPAE